MSYIEQLNADAVSAVNKLTENVTALEADRLHELRLLRDIRDKAISAAGVLNKDNTPADIEQRKQELIKFILNAGIC